jgi:diguanylate cyclase (GGDEF)-like protein
MARGRGEAEEGVAPRSVGMALAAVLGIAVIGGIDYMTGVDYRIAPVYYLPLSVAAWHLGRPGAITSALLAAGTWALANYAAGLRYANPTVWPVNIAMQAVSFVIVAILIADLRGAFERAAALSRVDALTALLNTRAFYEQVQATFALARRHRHPITVAYIDLDNFKAVNDTLGHHGGDELLRTVAGVMRNTARSADVIARLGGDEFALLLPETGPEGALTMLGRLQSKLAEALAATPCSVTASIGAVSALAPQGKVEDLVRQADALMYSAKTAGKNRVCLDVIEPQLETPPAATPTTPSGPFRMSGSRRAIE